MDDLPYDQREAEGMSTQGSRPRSVRVLIGLGVVNSLFGLLWPVFLPTLPPVASQPFAARPAAIVVSIYTSSLINLVVASGLWMRQQWAFRAGMIITVFTIAVEILVILVAASQTALDFGALLALVLNSVVLSFFLRPEVIRTVIAWKRRG